MTVWFPSIYTNNQVRLPQYQLGGIQLMMGKRSPTRIRMQPDTTPVILRLMLCVVHSPEESPDDLQINHQIRVEAHLVA